MTDEEFEKLIAYMKKVGEEIDARNRRETRRRADKEYYAFKKESVMRGRIQWWKSTRRR